MNKDENKLMEDLINKKNNQYKKFLDDKIQTWMSQIDNDINNDIDEKYIIDTIITLREKKNKDIDEECILDSIIELIEKKNKEIEELKRNSNFNINKYKSIVSV
jgi:hypothetical protein